MEYYFRLIIAAIIVFFSIQIFPQVKFASDSIDYQYAGKGLNDRIVYISFRDGTELKCKLVGYKEDTLVVFTKWIQKVPLSFIYKIKIENRNNWGWFTAGFYAGQVIFFSGFGMEKDAPVYRIGDITVILRGLLSLGSALIIGGIGGGINDNEEFRFDGTNEEIKAETIRLEEFLLGERINKKKFQLSFTASAVNTTYSKVKDKLEANMDSPFGTLYTSVNMVRKIQLTYPLTSKLDIGAAFILTGEPPFTWYKYLSYNQGIDEEGSFSYSGHGLYSVLQYNLTNSIRSLPFDLVVGGGPGFVKITYSNSIDLPNNRSYISKDKVLFSGYLYSSLQFRLNEYTLLGLTADYVIIPETKASIDYMNVKSESFSNFSYGISFIFEL